MGIKASCHVARHSGIVFLNGEELIILDFNDEELERYPIFTGSHLSVEAGEVVRPGQILAEWEPSPDQEDVE